MYYKQIIRAVSSKEKKEERESKATRLLLVFPTTSIQSDPDLGCLADFEMQRKIPVWKQREHISYMLVAF